MSYEYDLQLYPKSDNRPINTTQQAIQIKVLFKYLMDKGFSFEPMRTVYYHDSSNGLITIDIRFTTPSTTKWKIISVDMLNLRCEGWVIDNVMFSDLSCVDIEFEYRSGD